MKHYTIAPGAVFVKPDGTRAAEGETIELPDDIAALHADKLVQTSADVPVAEPVAALPAASQQEG
ncbi:MAG: hypothetical protein JSS57_13460 [Proteobacteria bacterium]|nr:hypothetical protein [Pseudomonadota bacterium]